MTVTETSLVISATQNQRNVGLSGAESLGYFGLRHRSAQRSDFGDFFFGQELREAQAEVHVDGVLFVHPIIDPLKVRGAAIRLHPVNMIDHRKIGRIGDEGCCDEAMDEESFSAPISKESGLPISQLMDARSENFAVAEPRSSYAKVTHTHSVKASNATHVADFVELLEASNGAPFFVDHQAGPFEKGPFYRGFYHHSRS